MGIESSSPFLRESWERAAQLEKGEDPLDKALGVYVKIEKIVQGHPEFQELEFKKFLDKAVLDYVSSVNSFTRVREPGSCADREELHSTDQHRRLAHEALVSTLNALSRNLYRKGLSNEWMKDVVQNRDTVARWAKEIAPFIEGQKVPEEEAYVI